MPVSYWCVLIAALLPFAFTAIAKGIGRRNFTNHAPRDFQSRLTGAAARAHWAHLNSFEAFAPFAASVLVAQQLHAAQGRIDALAIAFVALRVIYGACYIADQATLRSVVWAAGLACTIALFVIGA
ncbi:MAG: MAPEG family protein [Rudaea sp.]